MSAGDLWLSALQRVLGHECVRLLEELMARAGVLGRQNPDRVQNLDRLLRATELVERPDVEQIEVEIVGKVRARRVGHGERILPSPYSLEMLHEVDAKQSIASIELHGSPKVGFRITVELLCQYMGPRDVSGRVVGVPTQGVQVHRRLRPAVASPEVQSQQVPPRPVAAAVHSPLEDGDRLASVRKDESRVGRA